ncbi:MAG TPA: ZIP family metal transporter [Trueperaceae bacterium]
MGTFFSTSAGGLFALRQRDRLHLVLGFSAGVILSVVAFDLLPEIDALAHQTEVGFKAPMIALVAGFLAFHVVEKMLLIHCAHEDEYGAHAHPTVGKASALALAGHSLTDGIAIGLGFQVDQAVGVAVALAIIGHDFADGLNTVGLMLSHHNPRRTALKFLLLDALAPVLGATLTLLVHVPRAGLLLYLGVFAGFLLYVAASDVLPEAHSKHPSAATLLMTVLGAAAMYGILQAIG